MNNFYLLDSPSMTYPTRPKHLATSQRHGGEGAECKFSKRHSKI